MARTVTLTDLEQAGLLSGIEEQAQAEYPRECCGLVIEQDGGQLERVACRNLQDELHAKDPSTYTRTAATAYSIDPRAIIENEARLRCIYHSHPDHGAYFSDEDQLVAAPFGEPNFAGVSYLVVSVLKGRVADRRLFVWSDDAGRFVDAGRTGLAPSGAAGFERGDSGGKDR